MLSISLSADIALAVAKKIARCDFRTAISRYTTEDDSPWVITVGENTWRRHLVIQGCQEQDGNGSDILLGILHNDESSRTVMDLLDTRVIEKAVWLSDLIADDYGSVKETLCPA